MSVRIRPRLRDLPPAKLLAVLMPRAEIRAAELRENPMEMLETSPLLGAMMPYLYPGNLEGACINRVKHGWEGEVLLHVTKPGIPNAIATPQSMPRESAAAAVEDIITTIAMILAGGYDTVKAEKEPWFELHGLWIQLPAGYAAKVEEHSKRTGIKEERPPEVIGAKLDSLIAELLPAGVTEENMRALFDHNRDGYIRIMAVITSALWRGMFRWPTPTPNNKSRGFNGRG